MPILGMAQGDTLSLELSEVRASSEIEESTRNLKFTPLMSIDDALENLGGMDLLRRGPLGGDLILRGMGENKVELRINGLPVHGACTDRMDPASIYVEPSNLSKARLEQGLGALTSGAIAGRVDLEQNQAELSDDPWTSSSLRLGFSYPDLGRMVIGSSELHRQNWAFASSLSYRGAQNDRAPGDVEIPYSSYDKGNASVSLRRALGADWNVFGQWIYDQEGYVGYPALPMDVGSATASLWSVGFEHQDWGQIRIFRNQIEHAMDDTHRDSVLMHMDMPGWSTVQGVRLEGSFDLSTWTFPWVYEFQDLWKKASMVMYVPGEPNMVLETWPEARQDKHLIQLGAEKCFGAEEQHHFEIKGSWTGSDSKILSQMGRNQWSIFEGKTSAEDQAATVGLGLHLQLNPQILSLFETGWMTRISSLEERWGYYLYRAGDRHDRLGNPDLGSESSVNSELGLQYKAWLKSQFKLWSRWMPDARFWEHQTKIPPMTPGAWGVIQEQQGSDALWYGWEFSAQKSYESWMAEIKLQQVWGEDGAGQIPMALPPLVGMGNLAYVDSLWQVRWQIRASDAVRNPRRDLGEERIDPWMMHDLALNWKIPKTSFQTHLGVNNIWDSYVVSQQDWGIPRSGRTLLVGLVYAIRE